MEKQREPEVEKVYFRFHMLLQLSIVMAAFMR